MNCANEYLDKDFDQHYGFGAVKMGGKQTNIDYVDLYIIGTQTDDLSNSTLNQYLQ